MRNLAVTVISAAAVIAAFAARYALGNPAERARHVLKVGFVYEGDETTPYTNGFIIAQEEAERLFGPRIAVEVRNNVSDSDDRFTVRELCEAGCELIFLNSANFSSEAKKLAGEYPGIQFCQASGDNANAEPLYRNYHTFMGEIYQGRYVAGIVAGMKLRELIGGGAITEAQARIGYVGAYRCAEVISGYTAFLMGVRSVVPAATMTVRYTDRWSSYPMERDTARALIEEGCVIISQHSDTIGPAVACESLADRYTVFHVGYNQSMTDVAPTTSLTSTRINWTPYIVGAIRAALSGRPVERQVRGHIHGNDVGAGFEADWVQMLELNTVIAASGSEEAVAKAVDAFKRGAVPVFSGNYTGVNPFDPADTCDLRTAYHENAVASAPSFCYVLDGVVAEEFDGAGE